jgi:hypothetical protein
MTNKMREFRTFRWSLVWETEANFAVQVMGGRAPDYGSDEFDGRAMAHRYDLEWSEPASPPQRVSRRDA